ncbi:MAG: hypothetical protein RBG13Loki_1491, partial [Promethearchaeota archaeon CR_4]
VPLAKNGMIKAESINGIGEKFGLYCRSQVYSKQPYGTKGVL